MPQNTLYVTGFTRESKAADLAPDFEKFGELVRLDIPPPRSEDGQKFAFVEYKNSEDCEKALELDGKTLPFSMKDGLTVQVARSDPFSSRRGARGGAPGGYGRGAYMSRGGPRGGRGAYGYPSPYPPRGGRGGYGYQSYGYERGGYGGGYPAYPTRGGREPGYGGRESSYGGREPSYGGRDSSYGGRESSYTGRDPNYGGRDLAYGGGYGSYGGYGGPAPYSRDSYGYRGHDEYRGSAAGDDHGYESRDRYPGPERRRGADRNYSNADRHAAEGQDSHEPSDARAPPSGSGEPEEYGRGRYSRSNSPARAKSRSRSPSR